MLPWLIPAGMSVVKTGLDIYNKSKNAPKAPDNKKQLGYLRNLSENGYYTPEVKSRMLSNTARTLGAFTQRNAAATKGQLARIGAENSIAGVRAMGQANRDYAQGVQAQSNQISLENAAIKDRAKGQFAELYDQTKYGIKAQKTANRANLIGSIANGIGDIANAGMTAYTQSQQYNAAQNTRDIVSSGLPRVQAAIDAANQLSGIARDDKYAEAEQMLMMLRMYAQYGMQPAGSYWDDPANTTTPGSILGGGAR